MNKENLSNKNQICIMQRKKSGTCGHTNNQFVDWDYWCSLWECYTFLADGFRTFTFIVCKIVQENDK